MSLSDMYPFLCKICEEEINGVRVQCAECIAGQCLTVGAETEIESYKTDHAYSKDLVVPGVKSWSEDEQEKLLDAVEKFGYGKWEDIAKFIETRTAEEAKEEYDARYVNHNTEEETWGPQNDDDVEMPPTSSTADDEPECTRESFFIDCAKWVPPNVTEPRPEPRTEDFKTAYDRVQAEILQKLLILEKREIKRLERKYARAVRQARREMGEE
ncbi:unnamed protein product [Chrysodeixis includens]|uniref:Uncharacterized protein n=1 Tax=Chrysodeixis includens TaxID=689277 RepID=A0A9P0BNG3_CHRIL|nr:unnamed protein product [Chrysodeixis includens]